jgi:hypothetical protein
MRTLDGTEGLHLLSGKFKSETYVRLRSDCDEFLKRVDLVKIGTCPTLQAYDF